MEQVKARAAIRTRYHGATNYKPSRIIATSELGKVTISYDSGMDTAENHANAAAACLEKHWDFEAKLKADEGLCFNGDYFWTWAITGPRKTDKEA